MGDIGSRTKQFELFDYFNNFFSIFSLTPNLQERSNAKSKGKFLIIVTVIPATCTWVFF